MQTFITKQPILDSQKKLYGYELLSRSHVEGASEPPDVDQALSQVVTDVGSFVAMKQLWQGRRMFVSTPPDLLVSGHVGRLRKDEVVIKITDLADATAEVVAACKDLKSSGYKLAITIAS